MVQTSLKLGPTPPRTDNNQSHTEGRARSKVFVRWNILQVHCKKFGLRHFFYLYFPINQRTPTTAIFQVLGASRYPTIRRFMSSKRCIKPRFQGHCYHLQGRSNNLLFDGLKHLLLKLPPGPLRGVAEYCKRDDVLTAKVSDQTSCPGKSIPAVPVLNVPEFGTEI